MDFDPDAVREFERTGWNRAAAAYEASFAGATRQFIGKLLDAAAIEAGAAVLDLCCGPGFVGAAAQSRGARVTGLDFSAAMLDQARARFPGLAFDFGDAEALPYPDASFDAVVANFGSTTCRGRHWRSPACIASYGLASNSRSASGLDMTKTSRGDWCSMRSASMAIHARQRRRRPVVVSLPPRIAWRHCKRRGSQGLMPCWFVASGGTRMRRRCWPRCTPGPRVWRR